MTILLTCQGQELLRRELTLDPNNTYDTSLPLPPGARPQDLSLRVLEGARTLISFTPLPDENGEIPAAAAPAKPPSAIHSSEELFLNGLHLEQYRHATLAPEDYYEEGLRRDPLDSRCNNAIGRLLYRRGKFAEAENHFRTAIKSLTRRNPNPYDGEAFYNLGLALRMQGRFDEAYDAFYKAAWNAAWQDAAYFELARLAAREERFEEALDLLARSLQRNGHNQRARHLKAAVLRHLGHREEAQKEVNLSLEQDRLDLGALVEHDLLNGTSAFNQFSRGSSNSILEIALDYTNAGLYADAVDLLASAPRKEPMPGYFASWALLQAGKEAEALAQFKSASDLPPDYCFPNHLECVPALQAAMRLNPQDARASYYLGNFWYAHHLPAEAIQAWERAHELDPAFPTALRNLGLAYFNKLGDAEAALRAYERAFQLDPSDARVFFELDQLFKKINRAPAERLANLEAHADLVERRDDLTIERISLLNLLGRHADALAILTRRAFHPWEGGEGKTTGQYVLSLVMLARQAISAGAFSRAVDLLERAQAYPHNLGEGKLYGAQENHIFTFLGMAFRGQGERKKAKACFERAASGLSEPTSALYYNDQPPDMIFYQGLARGALGRRVEANTIFRKLVKYGQTHLDDEMKVDYFAVSLPDFLVFDEDLGRRNRIHCLYMMALGQLGLGKLEDAQTLFSQVLALDANHLGASIHRSFPFSN